ncbi:MAG: glycoside hydrolase family 95 protein [Clostridiales bacterium]|jgi:alpha-L-fucosidase 2|nr:glycoside hydrolase family 95 protein [Clostridiales bacterium]
MISIRKSKNAIRISRPSSWWGSTWREALPTGNGVIGAAVYGGAGQDVIMITHSDLWWQGQVGVLQDVADKLPNVRKAIDNNSFKEAENILQNGLISKGFRPQLSYPLPICDFKVNQPMDRSIKDYCRTLNMENGEISVSFRDATNKYDRSIFVSRVQDLICYEITKTGNKTITVDLSFDIHDKFNARTPTAISKLPDGVNIKYENFFMYFGARSDNGTDFGAVAKITFYGGSQVVTNKGIKIKDTDRVFVTIKPFVESNREKEWKEKKANLVAIKLTYDKLIKEHASVHSKLFLSTELDLDAKDRDMFADELLRKSQSGENQLALLEKLWGFGRHLLICSSTGQSKPQAPYGIWCGDYKAVNSQLSCESILNQYNHALSGNLVEFLNSVFSYYESHLDDLKKNSSRLYGCRGVFVPQIMAHGTGLLGSVDSNVLHFIACGGMVARLYWEYYLHTDDTKFLKTRALPFMKDVVLFYEEFFKVKSNNMYSSSPSFSPFFSTAYELQSEPIKVARNSTIDFAVLKEVLTNIIKASEVTGLNKSEIAKWNDMLTRIPKYSYEENYIREHIDEKLTTDDLTNPTTALYYPVFPGLEISTSIASVDLIKQFLQTARKRVISSIHNSTSVSLLKYSAVFARLGDAGNSYEQLNNAVKNMTMSNMVLSTNDWRGMGIGHTDIWATYTTEANSLITTVMQEWIVQSDGNTIVILPSLPEELIKGQIVGCLTRVGAEVDVEWDLKKGSILVKIKSRRQGKIDVIFPDNIKKVRQVGTEKIDYLTHKITDLSLPAGKVILLDMKV